MIHAPNPRDVGDQLFKARFSSYFNLFCIIEYHYHWREQLLYRPPSGEPLALAESRRGCVEILFGARNIAQICITHFRFLITVDPVSMNTAEHIEQSEQNMHSYKRNMEFMASESSELLVLSMQQESTRPTRTHPIEPGGSISNLVKSCHLGRRINPTHVLERDLLILPSVQ